MSEPIFERLSRFTPDAGVLDRDALLVAAGRRSAQPNRGWIALAAALAVSQTLSLVLLWPSRAPSVSRVPESVAPRPTPAATPETPSPVPTGGPVLWSARHPLPDPDTVDRPETTATVTVIDSGPPLRAFGPPPPSILH
jgi:hypothetical protein